MKADWIRKKQEWIEQTKKKRWAQNQKDYLELQKVLLKRNVLGFTNSLYTLHETVLNQCLMIEANAEILKMLSLIPLYQKVSDQICTCDDAYVVRKAIALMNDEMDQILTSLLLYFDQYQVTPAPIVEFASLQKQKKSTRR